MARADEARRLGRLVLALAGALGELAMTLPVLAADARALGSGSGVSHRAAAAAVVVVAGVGAGGGVAARVAAGVGAGVGVGVAVGAGAGVANGVANGVQVGVRDAVQVGVRDDARAPASSEPASPARSAPVTCWEQAAHRHQVNPHLLVAIAEVESSLRPHAIGRNHNGSLDLGLMQINTLWLPELRRHGITARDLLDPCVSVHVGAWVLAQKIRRHGNTWIAVGAYNAGSHHLRERYARKVATALIRRGHLLTAPSD